MERDERFAHVATDPTFRKRGKKKKVRLDKRFEGALTDERFGVASGPTDKRGKKTKKRSQGESLAPFYELEQPLDDAEQARQAQLEALARGEVDGSSSGSSDEESSGDESDELESAGRGAAFAVTFRLRFLGARRGAAFIFEHNRWRCGTSQVDAEAWDEGLPPTHELQEGGVETARLAVTDQEYGGGAEYVHYG